MSKKMIQLDPKFMSISKKPKNSKTQKKKESLRKSKITNTGALRKQLLTKIKDFQKKTLTMWLLSKWKDISRIPNISKNSKKDQKKYQLSFLVNLFLSFTKKL